MLGPLALSLVLVFVLTPRPLEEAVTADSRAEIGEPERPLIALTFDDGPDKTTTPRLLDGLAQRGVRATFFLIGEQVPGNEDLVRRMDSEGHQIGVHTYDHVSIMGLGKADIQAQVDKTRTLLSEILGREESFLLRPPYGAVDEAVKREAGSAIILWSVDPEDWKYKNTARVSAHIVSHAGDGDIVLLHDIYSTSVEAALDVIDVLRQRGYVFVTVEELAQQRDVELKTGQVYRHFYP